MTKELRFLWGPQYDDDNDNEDDKEDNNEEDNDHIIKCHTSSEIQALTWIKRLNPNKGT